VVLNDGSHTRVSSRGITTAPDISFVPSSWELHLTWLTGTHIGSDHLPIIIEAHGGSHTYQPRRKATFSYKKADWPTFQETLDLSLSQWEDCPRLTCTERTLCYPQPLLLQPRRPSRKDLGKLSVPGGALKWSKPLYGAVRPKKIFRPTRMMMTRLSPFNWPPVRLKKP